MRIIIFLYGTQLLKTAKNELLSWLSKVSFTLPSIPCSVVFIPGGGGFYIKLIVLRFTVSMLSLSEIYFRPSQSIGLMSCQELPSYLLKLTLWKMHTDRKPVCLGLFSHFFSRYKSSFPYVLLHEFFCKQIKISQTHFMIHGGWFCHVIVPAVGWKHEET